MLLRWLVVGALASLSLACETGVAFERNVLSVPRSLMANADVALLQNFTADSLKQCMEQCCTGRFGSCSVASFQKNSTSGNCLHFYCRPLSKCKFQSSPLIDSFSFSSNPTPAPSKTSTSTVDIDFKNDNTTIKPRKGVVGDDFSKSGIKPRKGVSLEDESSPLSDLFPLVKSNVKARKGVEPPPPTSTSPAILVVSPLTTMTSSSDDPMLDLAKILADDSATTTIEPSTLFVTPTPSTSTTIVVPMSSTTTQSSSTISSSSSTDFAASSTRNFVQSSSTTRTPPLWTMSVSETSTSVSETSMSGETSSSNHLMASAINMEKEEEDEENDRRYKSSIHLVLSLVFGLLVLVAVLGVVAKRIYDGWLRRDYYRMNYLIDGIYNGVE